MITPPLTGAEKSRLRGRGQTLEASLKIGREGASEAVVRSLARQLAAHALVKVRFTAGDRHERAALTAALALASESTCVGSVGATALFYRPDDADNA
ncbi:MAG: YhbY family RNA-binding protein [Opitutaceae bacterium]|nr:YhbY family RNA-binding protein [Opitutaceae bacterium]